MGDCWKFGINCGVNEKLFLKEPTCVGSESPTLKIKKNWKCEVKSISPKWKSTSPTLERNKALECFIYDYTL